MLDRQIHIYSVDTGHFYSNHEKYLHDKNCNYRRERNYLKNKLPELEKRLMEFGYTREDLKKISKDTPEEIAVLEGSGDTIRIYQKWTRLIRHKREKAKESKEQLLALLSHKVSQNELTNGKDHLRRVREDNLSDCNVISVFESALTRTIGMKPNTLTDEIMVVQVYYFDVFKDLSFYGFTFQGKKYKYYTSSAGQIRKKKAVFIRESIWNAIEKTVMCGLTIDKINSKGGNNVNKHLAYLALTNSATDEWEDFDIDKTIVIDDFETNVTGTFDFVDEQDYSITRMTDSIPIPHTDGAGMILPSLCTKNFMFRAPWIKGLLGVFDFRRFVEVNDCSPVITDIYGKSHDILEEDIQIIFTKSQFKMHPYYDSWEEYKEYYKKYHCRAGRCNMEEDRIKNAKINYQMLQTLTDITEEEIDLLTRKSAERIQNICNSRETMMEILGITPYNTEMTPLQKSIKRYPALLSDPYVKDVIREIKDSLLKKYRSGKLEVTGKYTFLLPDFYAACEYWFGHIQKPRGLLADQEVYCRLFRQFDQLDCLRSPHLYKEHAIRLNIANKKYKERADKIGEWFLTKGIYASTHDLISKLLMYDVDGDQSLVVADPDFVRIAKRNMEGVVPLYYNMKKAEPTELNSKNIFAGLSAAFTGGNIGVYSNHISKIWNDDVFVNGTEAEKQEAIDCVKRLCCQNNFVIDYAKTLYKPEFPKEIKEQIAKYTGKKLPAFFRYAKDKEGEQVAPPNGSFVNKIFDRIPNQPINTRGLELGKIEYTNMMGQKDLVCPKEVSDLYTRLNTQYRYMLHLKEEHTDNLSHVAEKIRTQFRSLGYSDETISDMLVAYLYGKEKRYKQLLWFCYGQTILHHLEKNILCRKMKAISCIDCGEWFEIDGKDNATCRCGNCLTIHKRNLKRLQMQRYRKNKQV